MNTGDRPEPPDWTRTPRHSDGPNHPESASTPAEAQPSEGHATQDPECARCQQLAPELALGVLCGRERAEVLVHLQRCGHCQDRVSQLAATADRLVELVPEAEPSPGFAQRVLAAIAASDPLPEDPTTQRPDPGKSVELPAEGPGAWTRPPRTTRAARSANRVLANPTRWPDSRHQLAAATAVAAACTLLITGGVLAATAPVSGPPSVVSNPLIQPAADVISAPLISDAAPRSTQTPDPSPHNGQPDNGQPGREIGHIWIHPQSPSWVYISITDTPSAPEHPTHHTAHDQLNESEADVPVTCTLIPPTGATINLGTFTLRNGHGDWVTPTTIDPHTLSSARLTIQHGHTLAQATFSTGSPPVLAGKDPGQDKDREKDHSKDRDRTDSDAQSGAPGSKKDDTGTDSKDRGSRDAPTDKNKGEDHRNAGGDHTDGAGTPVTRHEPGIDTSTQNHREGRPGDLRARISGHLGDYASGGNHHNKGQHGGAQHRHNSSDVEHHGSHHQHNSDPQLSASVPSVN